MFSVDKESRSNFYKYLAKLNFEAAKAADKEIGTWPGYGLAAPPPVMTLCAHSIELSLKAYLLDRGVEESEVKRHSHNLVKLWDACVCEGADPEMVSSEVLGIISDLLMSNRLRYGEESSLGQLPYFGPLSQLCEAALNLCGAPSLADIFQEK
ncbi:hypothetical protein [Epibacterium ulvae]|uniref:hypothetical protein n=1 Tax=Epibacterium ulvae TaxID=1156985 RepID=UPI00248FD219|nr:hypothetical protein [Epibacterium ulvae]